ncbi:MAG: bacterial Ig-like domain-containing protein [Clostridia bacterium]|nr:bacterial Ig-like domain-containing protein [Clostridia bacterium]
MKQRISIFTPKPHAGSIGRAFALLLAAAVLFTLRLPAAAEQVRYLVTAESALMYAEANDGSETVCTVYRGAYVTAQKEKGDYFYVTVRSTGISGWIHAGAVSAADDTASNPEKIRAIYIKSLPKKTTYIEGEETFSDAGLSVWASYTDGKADRQITGYRIYLPALNVYGNKTVYVRYRSARGGVSFGASFGITVRKVPILEIRLVSLPHKTEYKEHEALSLSGLQILIRYKDGRAPVYADAQRILTDPDFIISGCHNETQDSLLRAGSHSVSVTYKYPEFKVSFSLKVEKRTLTGIALTTPPDSLITYSKTAPPDLTGAVVTAYFDNGQNEEIPVGECTVDCDPASFVLGDGNVVKIGYGGFYTTLTVRYVPDYPVAMKVVPPRLLTFILGEPIDLTEMKVYVVYASGDEIPISDYTMSSIDPARTGPQTVEIRYKEYSDLFTIYINAYYQKGDVNGDGEVTATDARLALRCSVDLVSLKNNPLKAADVDRDGTVSAMDARRILRASVDLEKLIDV